MVDPLDPTRPIVGTVMLPGGRLTQAVVELHDGRIASVDVRPRPAALRALRRDPGATRLRVDEVLAPAFIDIHCHGAGGGDAFDGWAGLDLMARTLWRHGVGAFVATLMTAPIPRLLDIAAHAAHAAHQPAGTDQGSRAHLLGVHLEGPAISPLRSGGHDPSALVPASAVLGSLLDRPVAWSNVRLVTLAPELDGGPELIDALGRAGVVASVGHTDASADNVAAAYARGARSTTHLFNGMPPLHHREPGPVGAAMASSPFIELIADGVHVDQRLLAPLGRAIGDERLILVSDAIALAGTRRRRLDRPGWSASIRHGRAVHPDGALAGCLLLLDRLVEQAVRSGIPLVVALRAATENPARLLGLPDRGRIEPGARADLIVVSRVGHLRRHLEASQGDRGA
jgi:N-acetylglucosamine-6-phosphate deacetylase